MGWVLVALAVAFTAAPAALAGGGDQEEQDLSTLSLAQLGDIVITSASMHRESLRDAPASVTVITAEDIRRFGYRTLAQALAYVPGFYAGSDHTYSSVGIRGFSLPGYETRYIVMINGHSMADNIVDSTFVDYELPIDLSLVERIEVVRGPSSALYGSNAVLATINIVTRRPSDEHGTTARFETDSNRGRKVAASTAVPLGKRASLLLAGSVLNSAGARDLYFSEFDAPGANFGHAVDMDGEKGYHAFADLTWGNWEAIAVTGTRVKTQPVAWGGTVFNDRGTSAEDARGFAEALYAKALPGERELSWRTSYDFFRHRGRDDYEGPHGVVDNRQAGLGDWITSKFTYRLPDSWSGHLTLGTEAKVDLRALQEMFIVIPVRQSQLSVDQPDRYVGVFAQQEWAWGKRWLVNLGGRVDWSWLKKSSVSPRAAVVYKPTAKTDLKLIYGRGFRNPSSFDTLWDNNRLSPVANPPLRPETTNAYELDVDHAFTSRFRTRASAYRYSVNDLIQQVFLPAGGSEYVNTDKVRATGASLELACLLPAGVEASASMQIQRAVFGSGSVLLANSPGQVGKLRVTAPFWRDRLTLSAGVQGLGQRQTFAGKTLSWAILPEAVVATKPFAGGFQVTAGVQNLSNSFYREPVGLSSQVDSMTGAGRGFYFTLSWRSPGDENPRQRSNQAAKRHALDPSVAH
jgi:outer membrane receptor for ferrienterochelin and colicins